MIATSGSFSYIRTDSKGKPYTIRVHFTSIPTSNDISVMVQEVDEESGFQDIHNYYIKENSIGVIKNQQFNPIKSEVMDELMKKVLDMVNSRDGIE